MSLSKIRKELAKTHEPEHRCSFCGSTASWETLSTYGSRCGHCYAAYCRGEHEPRHLSVDDKKCVAEGLRAAAHQLTSHGGNAKSWAHRLREREQAGEALSGAQRRAWRAALPEAEHSDVDAVWVEEQGAHDEHAR